MVIEGSPAHRAGLLPRDVIISIGGKPVETANDLMPIIARYQPGERIAIEFFREEGRRKITVMLAQHPIKAFLE
jgi:S1-C subfamily serine protease